MLTRDAPLLLNPLPSWHKYSWMGEFLGRFRIIGRTPSKPSRLAIAAREHLFSIAERENIDFDLERRGILHIFHDKPQLRRRPRVNALLSEGGLDRHPVTPGRNPPPSNRRFTAPSRRLFHAVRFHRRYSQVHARPRRRPASAAASNSVYDTESTPITSVAKVSLDCSVVVEEAGNAADGADRLREIVVCAGVASRHLLPCLGIGSTSTPSKVIRSPSARDRRRARKPRRWSACSTTPQRSSPAGLAPIASGLPALPNSTASTATFAPTGWPLTQWVRASYFPSRYVEARALGRSSSDDAEHDAESSAPAGSPVCSTIPGMDISAGRFRPRPPRA